MQQVYDWRNTYDIAAVNMSLGGGLFSGSNCDSYSGSTFMKPLIDNLRVAGIPTVVAAGNEYSTSKLSFPACISSAIAVGHGDARREAVPPSCRPAPRSLTPATARSGTA
jgi:hypothetical protein